MLLLNHVRAVASIRLRVVSLRTIRALAAMAMTNPLKSCQTMSQISCNCSEYSANALTRATERFAVQTQSILKIKGNLLRAGFLTYLIILLRITKALRQGQADESKLKRSLRIACARGAG